MLALRFDVNDPQLRESFLRDSLPLALEALTEASARLWGKMSPRQMVEHLHWVFELSTGRARTDSPVPQDKQQYLRKFLYTNEPAPTDFMNPVLTGGLPPLRYPNLRDAKAALVTEKEHFLAAPRTGGPRYVHPLFGALDYDQWHRAHYKHVHHHLVQFELIESAAVPAWRQDEAAP